MDSRSLTVVGKLSPDEKREKILMCLAAWVFGVLTARGIAELLLVSIIILGVWISYDCIDLPVWEIGTLGEKSYVMVPGMDRERKSRVLMGRLGVHVFDGGLQGGRSIFLGRKGTR